MGKNKGAASAQFDALLKGGKKNRKKGKKGRKIGRYSRHPSSQRYKAEKRWLKNRVRRIERHLRKYPEDIQARRALEAAEEAA